MNFFIGLILGIIITFLFFVIPLEELDIADYLISYGKFTMIILPVICGIFGWVGGIIVGVFYNLGAKITKGIVLYS